jgi:hypothetical protein
MEYLNWMAAHWLLTLMLTWMITGGFFGTIRSVLQSAVERKREQTK